MICVTPTILFSSQGNSRIIISFLDAAGRYQSFSFDQEFVVGRDNDCKVRLASPLVSRHHFRVYPGIGGWWLEDLKSKHGVLIDGRLIRKMLIDRDLVVHLGLGGPFVRLRSEIQKDYNNLKVAGRAEGQTVILASPELLEKPTGALGSVFISKLAVNIYKPAYIAFFIIVLALSIFQVKGHRFFGLRDKQEEFSHEFYEYKTMELAFAKGDYEAERITDGNERQKFPGQSNGLHLKRRLNQLLAKTGEKSQGLHHIDQLILRVALIFGENPIEMPIEFLQATKAHILKWQQSENLVPAIKKIEDNGRLTTIYGIFDDAYLPLQFLYLGLIPSMFGTIPCPEGEPELLCFWGNKTEYYDQIDFNDSSKSDPQNSRTEADYLFSKYTAWVAKILREYYKEDAQGSGLLALAMYLDGGELMAAVKSLPASTHERNYWRLVGDRKITPDLQNKIVKLFSAAVIGEHPRWFGFEFDNPLNGVIRGDRHSRPDLHEMLAWRY